MFKFGTGGWRDIIADGFTKNNITLLAQSISEKMKKDGANEIVIGFDRRFMSDLGATWLAEVFAANGITVYYIPSNAPTPLIMFTVKTYGCKYGIAVTASHNPAVYNGVKVFTEGGRDANEVVTSELEEISKSITEIKSLNFDDAVKKNIIQIIHPLNDYIDSIMNMLDIDAIKEKGLKILLDPMFGVSKTSLQTILLTARCDVDIINDRHDTLFGGRLPSPSAATLTKLSDMVVEQGYDIGIATDGDADRIGIINEDGRFIHPNEILVLLYYYLLKYKGWKGDVVRNLATTHLLDKIAEDFGYKCHEVPVGFKHISSKMEETDAIIGGESSGGLTIKGHIKGKDGIFASSLLVEMICKTGKGLSEMLDEIHSKYGQSFMSERDFKFSAEKKAELQKLIYEDKVLPDFSEKVAKVSYMDGLKVFFENGGWIIARFSGTEPLIRIFCEMETKELAEKISDELLLLLGL
ncbi:MAG: phosphoglucomutase/phosphomannomutase family protein [Clostridia bacterium]|nr:phosphoglucomutase/phosphomannomutase family protein [Clostridia bacterium]